MGDKEGVMTVKVIATDMDGTFLTDKKTYDKVLFDRLFDSFMAEGIKFVVAAVTSIVRLSNNFLNTNI